ncbi:MAG: RcnB family protein [Undibacterium sp.]|uniref:RcnB family protein n=1 Tax=Undibacterium sp. TaxID=1914977 RepID=UPI00272493AA|nr:RcnB family protein [Undibacterium sp.]MDO8652761.1 RcnB family protein [Undibacterium sp.]
MNKKALISAVMAISLMTGTSAFAQGHERQNERGDRGDRGRNEQSDRGRSMQNQRRERPEHDSYQERGRNDRSNYQGYQNDDRGNGPRGAGPRHDMRRGQRIPNEYRGNQYVVSNWREHQLSAPPRGYHWVQTGPDYVLVAIVSGIIAQILLGN